MDIRIQHARHGDRIGFLAAIYLEELGDWVWMWRIADVSTQPGKANPTAIIDPGNWKFGLGVGTPPNIDGLTRPDDPDPPTNPEDMGESADVLPPAGQTTFTQTETEVTIHFGEAPNDPDGYWIFGLGDREHSQAVGPTENDVVLRQNNGTGAPYDPETLGNWPGTPWFCVKAFKDGQVSLDQGCNTFNFTPPVGAPPDPSSFLFTAPFFDRFRVDAELEGADGVEIELADVQAGPYSVVAGGPGEDQITQGQLPVDLPGFAAETTRWGRIRSFNMVDSSREYSNYVGPVEATTPVEPSGDFNENEPAGFTPLTNQPWDTHPCPPPFDDWRATCPAANLQPGFTGAPGPSALRSPPDVARVRIAEGMDGVGPFTIWKLLGANQWSELYFAVWQYIPASYHLHRSGNKQFWPLVQNHNNSPFTQFLGDGSNGRIRFDQQGGGWSTRFITASLGPSSHNNLNNFRNTWFRIEWYFRMNTVNSVDGNESRANGIVRCWVRHTGVTHLVLEATDVKYLAISGGNYSNVQGQPSNGKFEVLRWAPTYGGKGDPAPQDQFYYVDHIYASAGTG